MPRRPPDDLDMQILSALGQMAGKASAELLAEILHRPARTIRYRLNKLKRDGYLKFLYALTHDRKLGLADEIITLNLAPNVSNIGSLFREIPLFYYYGSTYGHHNGHLIHMTYPVKAYNFPQRFCETLVEKKIIDDYFIFDSVDFLSTTGSVEQLDIIRGWQWNWQDWIRNCAGIVTQNERLNLPLELTVKRAKFDAKDIAILRYLKMDAELTLREIGGALGLSQTQVNKRIKRMETDGIIKGYRWTTEPHERPLFIYLFVKVREENDPILNCLLSLPFPKELGIESPNSYLFRIMLSSSDLAPFFRGLDKIRGFFMNYTIQIVHHLHSLQMGSLYSRFDPRTGDWMIDTEEVLTIVDRFEPSNDTINQEDM